MDALARPKDDLFDNSTMTFGEHLEELRACLVKAIVWLLLGLGIGLFFANDLVRYIQTPLQEAIAKYRVDRDLAKFGLNEDDDLVKPFAAFLKAGNFVAESVFLLPADALATAEALPDPSRMTEQLILRRDPQGVSSFKVEESFMIWIKAGLIIGAVVSSPAVFYHLWSFVAAGLHSHERRYVYLYLPISVGLFVAGVALAFFFVLQFVLSFLLTFNAGMDVSVEPRLTYYVNFVLLLPLGFGIAFQLPIVMLFLQRIGIIETQSYIDSWRVAVVVIFVISMIVTPADPTSMFALAIPLCVLYALGVGMCMLMPRGRGLGSDAYDPA